MKKFATQKNSDKSGNLLPEQMKYNLFFNYKGDAKKWQIYPMHTELSLYLRK